MSDIFLYVSSCIQWNIIKNMVKKKKEKEKREKRTQQSTQKIRCFVYAGGNAGIQRLARRRCGFSKNSNGSAFCFDRLCRSVLFPLTQFEDIARENITVETSSIESISD